MANDPYDIPRDWSETEIDLTEYDPPEDWSETEIQLGSGGFSGEFTSTATDSDSCSVTVSLTKSHTSTASNADSVAVSVDRTGGSESTLSDVESVTTAPTYTIAPTALDSNNTLTGPVWSFTPTAVDQDKLTGARLDVQADTTLSDSNSVSSDVALAAVEKQTADDSDSLSTTVERTRQVESAIVDNRSVTTAIAFGIASTITDRTVNNQSVTKTGTDLVATDSDKLKNPLEIKESSDQSFGGGEPVDTPTPQRRDWWKDAFYEERSYKITASDSDGLTTEIEFTRVDEIPVNDRGSLSTDITLERSIRPTVSATSTVGVTAQRQLETTVSVGSQISLSTDIDRILEPTIRVSEVSAVSVQSIVELNHTATVQTDVSITARLRKDLEYTSLASTTDTIRTTLGRELLYRSEIVLGESFRSELNKLDKFDQFGQKHGVDNPREVVVALL